MLLTAVITLATKIMVISTGEDELITFRQFHEIC